MHYLVALTCTLALVACSKKSDTPEPAAPAAGSSAPAGSAAPSPGSAAPAAGSAAPSAGSGSSAAAEPAAGSAAGGSAAAGSAAFDFDKLTHEQKVEFMKTKVVPTMKPLFQDFDGKKYANFGCKTCHGKSAEKNKFKMPTPELPKLDFAALKAGKQAPKVAKFMADTVKPQMAKLLQQPEFTESNPSGFGCLECHEQKK